MTPESLQYACDLLNRGNDRTDSAQARCKVGKPCNGRCIPQDHECGSDAEGSLDAVIADLKRRKAQERMRSVIGNGLKAAVVVGGVGLAAEVVRSKMAEKELSDLSKRAENVREKYVKP